MEELWRRYKGLILYLIFGGVTTVVNVAVYHVCYALLGVPNIPSVIVSWTVSVAVAYLTNKLWVFQSRSFARAVFWPELGKFVTARAATGLLDLGIMYVGVDLLDGPGTAIKLGSSVLVIVLNYALSRLLIFKTGRQQR